ncbi:DUF4130 domain-containing protein [Arsenicitalea aurantiaca]|uniref:Type-4 uracil-DNA glycosylase n=1 Tax=Arsenicitalea aurantiaca TaxID=1783274 RepID=A0A433XKX3_9HYPH|nr:UdgX family uracil-DNA binding protein [Arsenicitalea aurantiaca]RUT34729.1 DUF4130 domain-containing protein [Arsenicitalea aurantiaca]
MAGRRITLASRNDFAEWRGVARSLLAEGVRPEDLSWTGPDDTEDLFGAPAEAPLPSRADRPVGRVPQKFIGLAEAAICHVDPERFALLYRLLWRLQKDASLLSILSDPDVQKLERRASAVRRDSHKMTAFVRFREIVSAEGERFAAWFEPDHFILERTAPFFVRRFSGMVWAIVTPYASAFWDRQDLIFGPGGNKADVPSEDAMEDAWRTYFASIFNPARLKVSMMKSEMPVKYWRNLPEAELIAPLIRGAREAESAMIEKASSQPPSRHLRHRAREDALVSEAAPADMLSLADARAAASGCTRCPLYEHATQTVFGEGPEGADIMFVGEQPGDQEDLEGRPFVGPAGQVFDAALAEARIDRARVYVTNAVKHFKFEPRGKRRLHKRPDGGEIAACRFWLGLERAFVRPRMIVALGATAAHSLLGRAVTIGSVRGVAQPLEDGTLLFVTVHPSYILRIRDRDAAIAERARFVAELTEAGRIATTLGIGHERAERHA